MVMVRASRSVPREDKGRLADEAVELLGSGLGTTDARLWLWGTAVARSNEIGDDALRLLFNELPAGGRWALVAPPIGGQPIEAVRRLENAVMDHRAEWEGSAVV